MRLTREQAKDIILYSICRLTRFIQAKEILYNAEHNECIKQDMRRNQNQLDHVIEELLKEFPECEVNSTF